MEEWSNLKLSSPVSSANMYMNIWYYKFYPKSYSDCFLLFSEAIFWFSTPQIGVSRFILLQGNVSFCQTHKTNYSLSWRSFMVGLCSMGKNIAGWWIAWLRFLCVFFSDEYTLNGWEGEGFAETDGWQKHNKVQMSLSLQVFFASTFHSLSPFAHIYIYVKQANVYFSRLCI